jgi:hypothetical protein
MKQFKVGDMVWVAYDGYHYREEMCPICFGKLKVNLILGNGDMLEMPCGYCEQGGKPTGSTHIHEITYKVVQSKIHEVNRREYEHGVENTYYLADFRGPPLRDSDVFDTESEAQVEVDKRRAKAEKDESEETERLKLNMKKSFTVNAGKHLTRAAELIAEAEDHKLKARLCTDKAKRKEGRE